MWPQPKRWGRREGGPDTRLATIRTLKIAQHHIGAAIGIGKQRFGILLPLEAALQLFLDDIADFHKATQAEALAIRRGFRTGKLDDGGSYRRAMAFGAYQTLEQMRGLWRLIAARHTEMLAI